MLKGMAIRSAGKSNGKGSGGLGLNSKRYHKNSNSSEFSIKSTLHTVIFVKNIFSNKQALVEKLKKKKISDIFGMDRDITKISIVLNSESQRISPENLTKIGEYFFFHCQRVNTFCSCSSIIRYSV